MKFLRRPTEKELLKKANSWPRNWPLAELAKWLSGEKKR